VKRKIILFADDNPDDRYLMLEAASRAGLREDFVALSDGEEVIAHLEKLSPDAAQAPCSVILDLSMPRKTGFDALAWIRQAPRWSLLPVFIMTASTRKGDARTAYQLGANGFLAKPTTLQELVELVSALKAFWLRFIVVPPCDEDRNSLL
jgi:CheY-like chemotaxis protein